MAATKTTHFQALMSGLLTPESFVHGVSISTGRAGSSVA